MNVIEELAAYLIKSKEQSFSYNTITNYKCRIKFFLEYFEHKASPDDITLNEFKEYLNLMISVNTRLTNVNAIKSFYLITGRTSIDFSGFNKTQRKKQPRFITDKKIMSKCIAKNLGVDESLIELNPAR